MFQYYKIIVTKNLERVIDKPKLKIYYILTIYFLGGYKMIDFKNASYVKLKAVDNSTYVNMISPIFVNGENIIFTFKGMRDGVVFTNKRIIAINVQGLTGTKKDFTSLPYSKIQSFSIETAGVFDFDSELELWFSGLGKVKFEFSKNANVPEICRMISHYVL